MTARKFSACTLVLLLTVSAFAAVSFGARADESSADAFGYYWTDSNAPTPSVAFNWIDITGTGTDVGFYGADTSYVGPLPIGFDFDFYGNTYSAFNLSCNGYIQFGAAYSDQYNDPIPATSDPDNIIAPFWDDLVVYDSPYNYGAVYYETIGTTPNQQLVVEFYEVSRDYYYNLLTFEIILNETGEIWFQYLTMNGETGSSATVGIENIDGYLGCAYSYNTASISDNLAIRFERGLVGFGIDQSRYADWGTTTIYTVRLTNGQAIDDSFDITVDSTVLGWTVEIYDVTATLLVDNNLNGIPDTGDLAPDETVVMYVYVTVPNPPAAQNETTVLLATSFNDPLVTDDVTLVTRAYQAHIGSAHTDWGYDADSDGDYDLLNVSIAIDSVGAGPMELGINLYDSVGTYITYIWIYGSVSAGSNTLDGSFDGEEIYSAMGDGPYELNMWLYDAVWNNVDYADYYTSAYAYTDFEPPVAMFSPPFSDNAVDTDLNGLYDYLVVNFTVEVFDAGYYSIESELYTEDWSGDWLGYQTNESYFDPGTMVFQLWFPSSTIAESTLDGVCWLYVNLYYENSTFVDQEEHYTSAYLYSDFEGPGAMFEPPYDDYAVDTDSDSYYNYVNVTVYLGCDQTGLYDLELWVYDMGWNLYAYIYETVSLTSGLTVSYTVTIDGGYIYASGDWGDFYLDMYLYDNGTLDEIDYDYYYTEYYYYWDFDPAGAYIYDIEDAGVDYDSDGLYSDVIVTVYVDPLSSGDFEVEADIYMYDPYYGWNYYGYVAEVMYMEEGVIYAYEIVLDGDAIVAAAGTYVRFYLDVYVNDETGTYNFDYWTYYYTNYYYDSDFDHRYAQFVPPYDDYGRDDDSDGYFDVLVEVLYIEAPYMSGYYDVEVDIYDPGWDWIDTVYYELYLEEGVIEEIEVEISSSLVWGYGYDGSWYLEMNVYDHATYDWYDYDYDYTSYLTVADFDSPPVVFDPPHTDYGLDTDEDSLYDYLMVEVEMDCYEAGTYTVYADLYDYWGGYITSLSTTETMSFGNEDVRFAFEGWILYYYGTSYYFVVELTLEDEDGMLIDVDTHYTEYYYYWEFEEPPARFTPAHSSYAVDTDEDSLYEYLVVNASVEVFVAGTYIVAGILYDWDYYQVDVAMAEVQLDEGAQVVQLWFDAWAIAAAYYDPYYVEMYLMDEDLNEMDQDDYYLGGYYDQTDFDPTAPSIQAGWAYEAPVIDGTVSSGEWFGAEAVDLVVMDPVNRVAATIYVLNNGTHLFILVDATGDTTADYGDSAVFTFDTGNDEVYSDSHEDTFILEALETGTYTRHDVFDTFYWAWVTDCEPFDPELADHEGIAGAAGFGSSSLLSAPHRIYELCIPLSLLMLAPGDEIGFASVPAAYDDTEGMYSSWPMFFINYPDLNMYGDLLLTEEPPLTTVDLDGDAGENDWFVSEVEVTLSATGGTGGVNATYYSLDGGDWVEYDGPFMVEDDGSHTLEYYSDDMAGNAEPVRTLVIGIDTVAPDTEATVSGTVGLADWFTSEATITFDVEDDSSGLDVIMYRLDGGDWTELSGTVLEVSEEGEHTLEFYAVDVAGHEEGIATLDFKVDMTAPETECVVDGHTVTFLAEDDASGIAGVWYRIDGGEWTIYDGAFEVTGKGNHTLEYFAVDVAGNNETVSTVTVEGKDEGILGLSIWIWAGLIMAIVVVVVLVLFLLMRRRPPAPMQMVPGQGVVQDPNYMPPPPPPGPEQ